MCVYKHTHVPMSSYYFTMLQFREKKSESVKFGQFSFSYRNSQFSVMLNYSLDFQINIEGNKFIV